MPISRAAYRSLAEVRYRIRRFLVFSEGAARAAGLEPQQHQLLLALKGLDATERPTIGMLAERLQIQHHSAVELVGRSVRRGLVRRHRGELDKREVTLHVTERGERLLERLTRAHRAELHSAAPLLVRALESLIAKGGAS